MAIVFVLDVPLGAVVVKGKWMTVRCIWSAEIGGAETGVGAGGGVTTGAELEADKGVDDGGVRLPEPAGVETVL